jgi:hypothetical protein
MTGYKMTKMVNQVLQDNGLKTIPAQMVYQYISKGWIPSQDVNGQKLVTEQDAQEWTTRYVTRRLEKVSK